MMEANSNTRISKSELISTLSDIDIKINNLHKRSATDFMQLNEHLKDYHKKTKLISENAFRIFETISGGKDIDLIKELGNIQNRIEDYRRNIDADNERKLKIFKDAYLKVNQLNIVVRNLRQDFTALKFLSTNYALISNYNDRSVNDSEINSWTQNLNDIHHLLVDLNEHVEKFRGVIASMIHELETRIERSIEIFRNLSGETIRNIDSVTRKKLESKQQFPVLKEKSLESSRCINDIITHLQYHDIIRQKIEHIQKSHYRIIDDLNLGGGNKEYCSAEDYVKIGDIIDLQAAQLLLVSKEYQNALNVITRNFQVIAKDMTIVSDISDKFTLESSSSETTLLRQIKDQLDKGIIQLDQNYAGNTDILTDAAFEKLQTFSGMIENDIKPQLSAFVTENIGNKFQFSPAGSGVLSQMISLNRDIEIKNQEIWILIAELKNLTQNTTEYTGPSGWANDFEIDRLQLMVRITRILDSLDRDNEDLDKVLNENREMNDNILSKIETAVNKSNYCEYFESIVGEVIAQLTAINNRINPSSGVETRSENLKEIKNGYTMESERIIHDMVVSGDDKIESSTSDNEIEFF